MKLPMKLDYNRILMVLPFLGKSKDKPTILKATDENKLWISKELVVCRLIFENHKKVTFSKD